MSRNRIIYQSEALFVGPTPCTGSHAGLVKQLSRVQSVSTSYSISRKDVNQFGNLAAISREIVDAPTVQLSFSYFPTDGYVEKCLGFNISGTTSCLSGILNKTQDEKNYFILDTAEGTDAANDVDTSKWNTIAIGNGYLSSYSIEGSVGNFVTANVAVEALNTVYDIGTNTSDIPAVDKSTGNPILGQTYVIPTPVSDTSVGQIKVIKPGDIKLDIETPFGSVVSGAGSANIQSFKLDIPLNREPLQRMGSRFAFSQEIKFPITVNFSVQASVTDIKAGALSDILCNDQDYNLTVTMNKPSCSGVAPIAMKFELKGFKLDSESQNLQIGSNKSVDLKYTGQIGSANDLARGVFITGSTFNA